MIPTSAFSLLFHKLHSFITSYPDYMIASCSAPAFQSFWSLPVYFGPHCPVNWYIFLMSLLNSKTDQSFPYLLKPTLSLVSTVYVSSPTSYACLLSKFSTPVTFLYSLLTHEFKFSPLHLCRYIPQACNFLPSSLPS